MYRVVSFIGLGLLLLVGAFIWQRLRPPALSDLRETPAGCASRARRIVCNGEGRRGSGRKGVACIARTPLPRSSH
jgi:hypothetical protein